MSAWLIIGNPENRRVSLFQEALAAAAQAPARVLSYLDILQNKADWAAQLADAERVRIESPGENFEVERLLLQLGGAPNALNLAEQRGRIYYPQHWYQGFSQLLQTLDQLGPRTWLNHPLDILRMFNKPLVKQLCASHALPTCPDFGDYAHFFEYVRQHPRPRFFIKLNYSSSASGVLAYQYNPKTGQARADTTLERVETANGNCFYNSLRLKSYTKPTELSAVIDFLFSSGAYVEPWIAKARYQQQVYDLRILAIAGQRRHSIARLSATPITNLHLGNQRCPIEQLTLCETRWMQIDRLVSDVMACFPNSLYAGLDVLIPRDDSPPRLLEANAFGDLLPNLLWQGKTTYQAELLAINRSKPEI